MSDLWRVEHALELVRAREESLRLAQEELVKAAGWVRLWPDKDPENEGHWVPPRQRLGAFGGPDGRGWTLSAACDLIRDALDRITPEPPAKSEQGGGA